MSFFFLEMENNLFITFTGIFSLKIRKKCKLQKMSEKRYLKRLELGTNLAGTAQAGNRNGFSFPSFLRKKCSLIIIFSFPPTPHLKLLQSAATPTQKNVPQSLLIRQKNIIEASFHTGGLFQTPIALGSDFIFQIVVICCFVLTGFFFS